MHGSVETEGRTTLRERTQLPYRTLAHIAERAGLAMTGTSCGLFVVACVSHTGIEMFRSAGIGLAMIVIGTLGFYLGIDVPSAPTLTFEQKVRSSSATTKIDPIEMLSAGGTLLATSAALISVASIVLDGELQTSWTLAVGVSWLLGALMQVFAGTVARYRISRPSSDLALE